MMEKDEKVKQSYFSAVFSSFWDSLNNMRSQIYPLRHKLNCKYIENMDFTYEEASFVFVFIFRLFRQYFSLLDEVMI